MTNNGPNIANAQLSATSFQSKNSLANQRSPLISNSVSNAKALVGGATGGKNSDSNYFKQ